MSHLAMTVLSNSLCHVLIETAVLTEHDLKTIKEVNDEGRYCFVAVNAVWETEVTTAALHQMVTGEVTGVIEMADMSVAYGFDMSEGAGMVVVEWKDEFGLLQWSEAHGSPQAVHHMLRLINEGDQGNEASYVQVEGLLRQLPPQARCVP